MASIPTVNSVLSREDTYRSEKNRKQPPVHLPEHLLTYQAKTDQIKVITWPSPRFSHQTHTLVSLMVPLSGPLAAIVETEGQTCLERFAS